jgi:hypothetical protein
MATAPPAQGRADRAQVKSMSDDDVSDRSPLFDELEPAVRATRGSHTETVLPLRSEAMQQVADEEAEAEKNAAKSKKKKKRKKKRSGYFDPKDTLSLVAGVGAVVGVLAGLAWGYPDFRFPLGGFLCVFGFIVYLLGSASLRQLVAEEGLFKALMFRFFPPYQLWFIARNWAETKDYVAFFAAGFVVMSIGGAVIKLSPSGQRAEALERAYQRMQQGPEDEAPPAVVNGVADDGD